MNYKEIAMNNYNINFVKMKKFKTTIMRIYLRKELKKDDYTYQQLLTSVMSRSTKSFPTKREMLIAKEELYDLRSEMNFFRTGITLSTYFVIDFINEEYTEKGMLEKNYQYLLDMIYEPNVKEDSFSEEEVKLSKERIMEAYLSLKNNKSDWAYYQMLNKVGGDRPYAWFLNIDCDLLEKITAKDLYKYYLDFINNAKVEIYIVGDVDEDRTVAFFKDHLQVNTSSQQADIINYEQDNYGNDIKEVIEFDTVEQTKAFMFYTIGQLNTFEQEYALDIAIKILNMHLKKRVREEHSLCYSIGAFFKRYDKYIVIESGIDFLNKEQFVNDVKDVIENICHGNFSEEDLETAKKLEITQIIKEKDKPSIIIGDIYLNKLVNQKPSFETVEEYQLVNRQMILAIMEKINLQMSYFLTGGSNEEN